MDISTMPTADVLKAIEVVTDILDIMPDAEFKTWFRTFAITTLAKQKLPDDKTLNMIKALRELDDAPADELRGFVKELFADLTEFERRDERLKNHQNAKERISGL